MSTGEDSQEMPDQWPSMTGSVVMILHGLRAGSPVVTDTGCCPIAARRRRPDLRDHNPNRPPASSRWDLQLSMLVAGYPLSSPPHSAVSSMRADLPDLTLSRAASQTYHPETGSGWEVRRCCLRVSHDSRTERRSTGNPPPGWLPRGSEATEQPPADQAHPNCADLLGNWKPSAGLQPA